MPVCAIRKIFVHGFDRPNIYLRVDHFDEEDKKLEAVVHRVRWADKPGIATSATISPDPATTATTVKPPRRV